jgi:hypothetical protein
MRNGAIEIRSDGKIDLEVDFRRREGILRSVGIRLTAGGSAYITGWTQGSVDSGYLAVKYASDGRQLWTARFKPDNVEYMDARAMAVDPAGDLYMTGFGGTIKYDSEGLLRWSDSSFVAGGLAVNSNGEVYVGNDAVVAKYVELPSGLRVIERPQNQIVGSGSDVTHMRPPLGK